MDRDSKSLNKTKQDELIEASGLLGVSAPERVNLSLLWIDCALFYWLLFVRAGDLAVSLPIAEKSQAG